MSRAERGHRPLRIATVGFQGFGNVGDEAILTGIEELLRARSVRVTTVFSGPAPAMISAFPGAERIVCRRHVPTVRALRELRRVDLLLLTGGGIFNDHWFGVIPRYVGWTVAARLTGVRVAWIGVGVGPIRRRTLRWLARIGARLAHLVTVRDPASAGILGGARSIVVPDPSVFNAPPERRSASGVGVIVRGPTRGNIAMESRLITAIIDTVRVLQASGQPPVVMTMAGIADEAFTRRLRAAVDAAGSPSPAVEALGPAPADALRRLATLSGVITLRLHGLLLAALAGVPVVPIAYDMKVHAAAERLGLGDVAVALPDVSASLLLERLSEAASEGRRSEVGRRLGIMRAERETLASMIVAAGGQP